MEREKKEDLVRLADNKRFIAELVGINPKNLYFKNYETEPDLEEKIRLNQY